MQGSFWPHPTAASSGRVPDWAASLVPGGMHSAFISKMNQGLETYRTKKATPGRYELERKMLSIPSEHERSEGYLLAAPLGTAGRSTLSTKPQYKADWSHMLERLMVWAALAEYFPAAYMRARTPCSPLAAACKRDTVQKWTQRHIKQPVSTPEMKCGGGRRKQITVLTHINTWTSLERQPVVSNTEESAGPHRRNRG